MSSSQPSHLLQQELETKNLVDHDIESLQQKHPNLQVEDCLKYRTPFQMRQLRDSFQAEGKQLVITSGCFDILHQGHQAYLPEARRCGDALLIAVNSDQSVRALKGPGRPIRPEAIRVHLLSQLDCVDYITVFSEKSLRSLVLQIRPQAYAKGGDYTMETIHQDLRQALEEVGTQCHFLSLVSGVSTTKILEADQKKDTLPPAPL